MEQETECKSMEEYVQYKYGWFMRETEKQSGRPIDPREGGVHKIEHDRYGTVTCDTSDLRKFNPALRTLLDIAKSSRRVSPDELIRTVKEFGINLHGERSFREEYGNCSNQEMVDAFLNDCLDIGDNYTLFVWGNKDNEIQRVHKHVLEDLTDLEVTPIERGKPYSGKEGYSFHIKANEKGHGVISNLDEWNRNFVLARWHGISLGAARFAESLGRYCIENMAAVHVNAIGSMANYLVGSFYDPDFHK